MNWLGKMFKKKKKGYNTDGQYKLLIIDEKEELLHAILGISDERAEVLTELCLKAYDDNSNTHSALEQIVNECKHTNEVVMATLIFQKIIDKYNNHERVHNLLKNMFGRG